MLRKNIYDEEEDILSNGFPTMGKELAKDLFIGVCGSPSRNRFATTHIFPAIHLRERPWGLSVIHDEMRLRISSRHYGGYHLPRHQFGNSGGIVSEKELS